MDDEQRAAFKEAVDRKKAESEARSHEPGPPPDGESAVSGDQHSLIGDDRKSQDVYSVRDKNSGKGRKTADKWNQ